jgi:hypothetical protein
MAKAQKVGNGEWAYRSGCIIYVPVPDRYIGNFAWNVCGACGRAFSRKEAKQSIDSLLRQAKVILDSEERSPVHGKGRA